MKKVAIIGPTASGKSDLAIEAAQFMNAWILSVDSLAVYKEADIVSAKPSKEERSLVPHFGIDELYIDEYFSVDLFLELYKEVESAANRVGKNLIIVGGTSFYLKTLIEGLSAVPSVNESIQKEIAQRLENVQKVYAFMQKIDPLYMQNIAPTDRYRIEKALSIYLSTQIIPSEWFRMHPPVPVATDVKIFDIAVERSLLRKRIEQRTKKMLQEGLIDEIAFLEWKYGRAPNPMKAIGIVETLAYLDGKYSKKELYEAICTHTAQLAKRQQTFNKNQFQQSVSLPLDVLRERLRSLYAD